MFDVYALVYSPFFGLFDVGAFVLPILRESGLAHQARRASEPPCALA
jgi:hypothetical protein